MSINEYLKKLQKTAELNEPIFLFGYDTVCVKHRDLGFHEYMKFIHGKDTEKFGNCKGHQCYSKIAELAHIYRNIIILGEPLMMSLTAENKTTIAYISPFIVYGDIQTSTAIISFYFLKPEIYKNKTGKERKSAELCVSDATKSILEPFEIATQHYINEHHDIDYKYTISIFKELSARLQRNTIWCTLYRYLVKHGYLKMISQKQAIKSATLFPDELKKHIKKLQSTDIKFMIDAQGLQLIQSYPNLYGLEIDEIQYVPYAIAKFFQDYLVNKAEIKLVNELQLHNTDKIFYDNVFIRQFIAFTGKPRGCKLESKNGNSAILTKITKTDILDSTLVKDVKEK